MIQEKQKVFIDYMNEFVKLDIKQKNLEIIEKQKAMLTILAKYAIERGIDFDFLKSKEINDIENYKGTNEDYLEAMMVYTHNIEELVGLILNNANKEYKGVI